MVSDIPKVMKALVLEQRGSIAVKDHPVPEVGPKDILVKTVAVALNPTDWKHVDSPVGKPGTVLGCDLSGTVVKVGADVTTPKVGDHVAAFVHGATFPDEGAFAEYVKTPAELAWVVPPSTLTHEQAATLSCALWTAAQALYHPTRLALVQPPQKAPGDEWILVYGGSSAVGQAAIQLAHLSGYKVVTTASTRNFPLVRSLGADEVFDYRDPEVVDNIKDVTADSIAYALDAISEKESQRITAQSMGSNGGKMVVVLKPDPAATDRADVEVKYTLLYTALGRAFELGPDARFPVSTEDVAQIVEFVKKIPELVQDGSVKPLSMKLWEGGLDAIPDGLQYMREGKVSGEKIVYKL
ncbi:GroES-like protein [Lentinus tigrinus ALCF2SS1-7]|uniref:GroES-like protein n=1 Tax=Lentinus tigrinus ALCF2SS1-6 TaxID=1328759 RepID=A0A5C2SSF4_9APHY|nr:GroES-like protein [Lentinus tigrinus ALCF2SS1-6]RPD80550.1 GroES-like protein [Lentinus tigrinus ALCF2SS1-7]